MDEHIEKAVEYIVNSKKTIALTGAGISVESGIPPFRGKGGVWEKIDPMEYAHIESFNRDPVKVWNVLIKEMKTVIDQAQPNDAHLGLARLEAVGRMQTIITQNVDGLHQKAGNTDVIEFHGTFAWHQCVNCKKRIETVNIELVEIPPKCECGGIYRPEVVFFGEMIPHHHLIRSREIASQCDLMLVIGTSAVVQPAAFMPVIAKENGAKVIEINPESTPLTGHVSDFIIKGDAGPIMSEIASQVEKLISRRD